MRLEDHYDFGMRALKPASQVENRSHAGPRKLELSASSVFIINCVIMLPMRGVELVVVLSLNRNTITEQQEEQQPAAIQPPAPTSCPLHGSLFWACSDLLVASWLQRHIVWW